MPNPTTRSIFLALLLGLSLAAVLPDKECDKITCPKDSVCSKGLCVKSVQEVPALDLTKIVACPTVKDLKPIACGSTRPTEDECPEMMFIR